MTTTKMGQFHEKHGSTATWAGAIIAICALVSTGLDRFDGKEAALEAADSQMKLAIAREVAGLKEWKAATIRDLEQLEAAIVKLQYELAVSTTTVELMSKGQRGAAKATAAAVSRSVAAPAPARVDEVKEITVDHRRVKDLPKPIRKSSLNAAVEIVLEQNQVQMQSEEMFRARPKQ